MEAVLQEFKEKTVLKTQFTEILFATKNEDTDWELRKLENQEVFYNEETKEYVWKNPYYAWRFKEKYAAVPFTIKEWIRTCDSVNNLHEIIEETKKRISDLS